MSNLRISFMAFCTLNHAKAFVSNVMRLKFKKLSMMFWVEFQVNYKSSYDYLRAVCACAIVKECISGLLFRVVPLLAKLQS